MRILSYSPDSYGLGHVRRTISLMERLLGEFPRSSALVLTGAPRAHYFRYPEGCDYLKLPSVTKDRNGRYVARELEMSLEETVRLRGRLIVEAVVSFRPDVLLVDHSPLGLCGEIVPALERLPHVRPGALRVLGMRDVIDEPCTVRASWRRDRIPDALRSFYDRILVYGRRDLFDPVRSYRFPADVARKTRFVGYIPRRPADGWRRRLRAESAPRTDRLLVVTLGGGGDGNPLLRKLFEGLEAAGPEPGFETVIVTGPLMSPGKRERTLTRAGRLPGVSVMEHCERLPELLAAADFVVSMGGYNTVVELACAGAAALIVPRCFPRREQWVRARLLAERGVVRCLHPRNATPERLLREIREGLDRDRPPADWGLDFSGLENVARELRLAVRCPAVFAAAGESLS